MICVIVNFRPRGYLFLKCTFDKGIMGGRIMQVGFVQNAHVSQREGREHYLLKIQELYKQDRQIRIRITHHVPTLVLTYF